MFPLLRILMISALLWLSACGGGGGAGAQTAVSDATDGGATAKAIGKAAASAFLTQAGFGGTLDEINALSVQPDFEAWFAQQASAATCLQQPRVQDSVNQGLSLTQDLRVEAWWHCVVQGDDALRQRMAFALSQILVVSDQSILGALPQALVSYYDLLSSNALGNYRTLLGAVARSPAMGMYLNMLGSSKANPALGTRADENFARELMQLFTVGLVKLNNDGTVQLDGNGQPLPTYTQTDVEQLADTLTGWGFADGNFIYGTPDWSAPMAPSAAFHDASAKTIIGGAAIPAGMDADAELDRVLDTLFQHPNVAPFISRQLIQRLVTSNPSPAYVARVAAVFNNNGSGVRGDLLAVAKAILTDAEAHATAASATGKLREPLLRVAQLWRSFHAQAANGRYDYTNPEVHFAEAPLRSPSVFNFYRPDYSPPGALTQAGIAAPELQIINDTSINLAGNALYWIESRYQSSRINTATDMATVVLDIHPWETLAADPAALVGTLDLMINAQRTPSAALQAISSYVAQIPSSAVEMRIIEALDVLMHAPQSYVQH